MTAGGMSAGAIIGCGMSAGGMSAGGMSAGSMPKRQRKKKESGAGTTGGDLRDVINTVGDVGKAVGNIGTAVLPYAKYAPLLFGLGKGKTRTDVVKEVMAEKGLK